MGKVSITTKSGVAGTEGWMAPEIFGSNKRVVRLFFAVIMLNFTSILSNSKKLRRSK